MAATLLPDVLWDLAEPFLPIPPRRPKGGRPRVSDRSCLRQQAGVWDLIHFALLDWLARDDQIDWSRAIVDSCSIRAVYAGNQSGPNPTDRGKRGSKRHLICDARGMPLAVRLTDLGLVNTPASLRSNPVRAAIRPV
jgi:hypothetical protein